MKFEVVYSSKARSDLERIYDYIADHAGSIIARKYTKQIEQTCKSLRDFPMRGVPRDDIRHGLRITSRKRRVVIVYAVEHNRVVIHGIFYGGRDYEGSMRDEKDQN